MAAVPCVVGRFLYFSCSGLVAVASMSGWHSIAFGGRFCCRRDFCVLLMLRWRFSNWSLSFFIAISFTVCFCYLSSRTYKFLIYNYYYRWMIVLLVECVIWARPFHLLIWWCTEVESRHRATAADAWMWWKRNKRQRSENCISIVVCRWLVLNTLTLFHLFTPAIESE